MSEKDRGSCPICGGDEFLTVSSLIPLPYENANGMCVACYRKDKEKHPTSPNVIGEMVYRMVREKYEVVGTATPQWKTAEELAELRSRATITSNGEPIKVLTWNVPQMEQELLDYDGVEKVLGLTSLQGSFTTRQEFKLGTKLPVVGPVRYLDGWIHQAAFDAVVVYCSRPHGDVDWETRYRSCGLIVRVGDCEPDADLPAIVEGA
jgi:hypothetical protein